MYEVINLSTNESHGSYDSLELARGCVEFDELRSYQIWEGYMDGDEFMGRDIVEYYEPYDERAGLGLPNHAA